MGNIEKPLTWILSIVFMACLVVVNCDQLCHTSSVDAKCVEKENKEELYQDDNIDSLANDTSDSIADGDTLLESPAKTESSE